MRKMLLVVAGLMVALSAACAPAVPTPDPAQIQASAVAAASTMVALTQQAQPTATEVPPTPPDRGAWLPVGLFILLMIALVFIIGVGEWVLTNIAPAIYTGILVITTILGSSVGVHLILFPPLLVIRKLLSHLTGLKVA